MKETKKAFVLMPFKEPYNSYYSVIYKPALETASYVVSRADDLFTPRPIMLDIQQSITEANLILCDMSERNPNVFYELGLAHAIGKPAILIARKEDDIPFDLRHIRVTIFDYTYPGWEEKLRQSIIGAARAVNKTKNVWPPPLIVSQIASSLDLEPDEREQLHNLRKIRNEITRQEIVDELDATKSKHELEIKNRKLDFYAPLIKNGQWNLLALQLAEHPNDIETITSRHR